MFSEVAEIALVTQRRGQFQQLLKKTCDINPSFYKDPLRLLVNNMEGKIPEFLNALKLRQLLVEGHRSCTHLNLLASFFHSPIF